jgi:hypothetical protein
MWTVNTAHIQVICCYTFHISSIMWHWPLSNHHTCCIQHILKWVTILPIHYKNWKITWTSTSAYNMYGLGTNFDLDPEASNMVVSCYKSPRYLDFCANLFLNPIMHDKVIASIRNMHKLQVSAVALTFKCVTWFCKQHVFI